MTRKIMVIPAKSRGEKVKEDGSKRKLRVAAYCRVSTDSEEQAGSFTTQVNHYTNYISRNPEWVLVDIFADEGISGTNTKNRTEFNRMIKACDNKEIDLIITKSISRFARNTLDCLTYIRQLKELGIAIYFEKENINTLDAQGELLITIMASLAQQESESMSKNIKLGIQYRNQAGQVSLAPSKFLGYDMDENKQLVINEEQAKVVRRIFKEYLEGKGTGMIAKGLEEDKIPTATGITRWVSDDINRIISNEKYMGDALLQKTYTTDPLTKRRVKNEGEVPQYYIENNHEPIVSKGIFALAQEEKAKRSSKYTGRKKKKRLHQGKYALSGIVYCGKCKDIFYRVKWNSRGSKNTVWRCSTRAKKGGYKVCKSRKVDEADLHQAIVYAINELIEDKEVFLNEFREIYRTVLDEKFDLTVDDIDEELHSLQKELLKSSNRKEDYEEIADKIHHLREEKQQLMIENATREEKRERIADMDAFLNNNYISIGSYDDGLVRRLVEKVIVCDDELMVCFKSGIEIAI